MTVKQLRTKLQRALDNLDGYDDDQEVHMVSNTYFLGEARLFLGVAGYDGGYINLDDPVHEDEDEEDY